MKEIARLRKFSMLFSKQDSPYGYACQLDVILHKRAISYFIIIINAFNIKMGLRL